MSEPPRGIGKAKATCDSCNQLHLRNKQLGSRTISKTPVPLTPCNLLRLRLPYRLQQWVHQFQAFKKKSTVSPLLHFQTKESRKDLRLPPSQLLARKQPQLFSFLFPPSRWLRVPRSYDFANPQESASKLRQCNSR